jgi:DNA primase
MAFVDFTDALLSQIRQAADIVEFINQVTPLKPAGRSFKGLCPFHREKTPSFHADRDKGLFYCFGCHTGGDVFKFLMLTERYTFPEAVEHVAGRVGIPLPTRKRSGADSDRDDLLGLVGEAAAAYRQALGWLPNPAETYLRHRGLSQEFWVKYGFGFAPESWDYLLTRLGGKYTHELMEKAGLAVPRKSGTGFYDRFRNRLMIPIHSEAGTLIGFGGRSLDGSDPKYLNSPESPLFNKSTLLYNLNRSRDHIRRSERAILVEGYFDALALDDAGVQGVVASMGTSLTPGQAGVLRKLARRVVIAYDGDDAGRSAALRAAPILLSAGLAVDIADVGRGEDPDTLIRRDGVQGFMDVLARAQDVFRFALDQLAPNPSGMTAQEKGESLQEMEPLLAAVADPVLRNEGAQIVADGLRLEFETVWSRVRPRGQAAQDRKPAAPAGSDAEKRILAAMLFGAIPEQVREQLTSEHFEDGPNRNLYLVTKNMLETGQSLDFSAIATHLRGDADLTRLSEIVLGGETDEFDAGNLDKNFRTIQRRFLDRRLRALQSEIQEASTSGDSDRVRALDLTKQKLSKELHTLK